MGKGFNIEGISGQCVVELMQNAINRHDGLTDQTIAPNKIIKAICNDAVGTLVSSSYEHQNVKIGLICGTGLNASYEEFTENIKALRTEVVKNHEKMLINTEVGVFGSNEDGEEEETEREFMIENGIFTNFDREIDEDERFGKPEFLVLEKMCSGKYLGEIVRRILRSLSADVGGTGSVIFKNCEDELNEVDEITGKPCGLREKVNLFDASFLSKVEKLNVSEDIEELQEIILDNCKVPAAQVDVDVVHKVCSLVSLRSATLVACAMVGLAKKVWNNYGEESGFEVICGVDGSLYTKHPRFADNLKRVTNGLLPDGLKLKYVRSHDASGKGAALMAAGAK
jgi:hexokinase